MDGCCSIEELKKKGISTIIYYPLPIQNQVAYKRKVKKIGRGISDVVDKISDTVANVKKRIKVNKEIKRRTKNKNTNGNPGSSHSRTLPPIGSTKIPRY